MCIRDRNGNIAENPLFCSEATGDLTLRADSPCLAENMDDPVSYTHLRAHETVLDIVCRLLLEQKKQNKKKKQNTIHIYHKVTMNRYTYK